MRIITVDVDNGCGSLGSMLERLVAGFVELAVLGGLMSGLGWAANAWMAHEDSGRAEAKRAAYAVELDARAKCRVSGGSWRKGACVWAAE